MGIAPSIDPPTRDWPLAQEYRWPRPLRHLTLVRLVEFQSILVSFTSDRITATARELLSALEVEGDDEGKIVADIWGITLDERLDPGELLSALVTTSAEVSMRTKLAFLFRNWDSDVNGRVGAMELVILLRSLISGVGKYCNWPSEALPNQKSVAKFVERTFRTANTEADFITWAVRHKLVRCTLLVFSKSKLEDNFDFSFAKPFTVPTATSLPKIDIKRYQANKPSTSVPEAPRLGRLTVLDNDASRGDVKYTCPLHASKTAIISEDSNVDQRTCNDVGDAGSHCMLLTKHEVLLASRLWHCFRESPTIGLSSVRGLLFKLQTELAKQDSLLAKHEHRHIFILTDIKHNRLFADCIFRLRQGKDVKFREFLHAVCPCASPARLDLMVRWHASGNFFQEQAFMKLVKQWRQNCDIHWSKQVLSDLQQHDLEVQMLAMDRDKDRVLSINDLVNGALLTREEADEMIRCHDLNGDHVLNLNEYMEMFCPEGQRSKSCPAFEILVQKKFDSTKKLWQSGDYELRSGLSQERANAVLETMDDDEDGNITVDELVGHVDLQTAFGFMEAYDDNRDGNLSGEEFRSLLDPNQLTTTRSNMCKPNGPASRHRRVDVIALK